MAIISGNRRLRIVRWIAVKFGLRVTSRYTAADLEALSGISISSG